MAWTPTIKSKERSGDRLLVTVAFTDGTKTIDKTYEFNSDSASAELLKGRVAAQIVQLANLDTLEAALNPGDPVDTTPAAIPQAEQDRRTWVAAWQRLQAAQKLVDLGIIQASNAKFVALQNNVKSTLKPEYLDSVI